MQRLLLLSEANRARIAERMPESLGARDDVEPMNDEWKQEIAPRLQSYFAGQAILDSPEDVLESLRERTSVNPLSQTSPPQFASFSMYFANTIFF